MTGVSTVGISKNQVDRLNAQQELLEKLAMQLATGKKTQRYSGLGNSILTTQRARADLSNLDRYVTNIRTADVRMQIMTISIDEYQEQARALSSSMTLLSQENIHQLGEEVTYDNPLTPRDEAIAVGQTSAESDSDLQATTDLAEDLYGILTGLLNTKDDGSYVFSGSDKNTPALSDNGLLDSAMNKLITDWKEGAISNDELVSALTNSDSSVDPNAITDTTIGFSAALSSGNTGNTSVRVSDDIEIDYTVNANDSALRDVLVAVAFLKNPNLTPVADVYTTSEPPAAPDIQGAPGETVEDMKNNFFDVFNQIQNMLADALSGVQDLSLGLASNNARALSVEEDHAVTQNFLVTTVSDIEDVNLDEVAVKISTVQTQLEASYAITAQVQQLSLVNYL